MTALVKSSITDIPRNVSKGEKDNFGIEPFEKGLTRFIEHTNTPITIALQGEWGSGKTSLMNSLKRNLTDVEKAEYHSIWLNTWEYALMKDAPSTLIDIITGLIEQTSKIAKIDESQTAKIVNKLWGVGKSAAKFAAKTAADKVVAGSSTIVDSVFEDSGSSSIGEIREELETVIEACIKKDNKKGFLFFIDDLDRIDPPIAVQLLELLKNIFTLKNCVFVLAIDYDVIIKGLEPKFGKLTEKNEREFRSFFDKIIQVPFSMPVTSYKVDGFLKDSLLSTNYLNEAQSNNSELISKFSEISNLSVGSNPRALKRLLNSLSLISCINATKGSSAENDQLNDDLELLVNFTLVSIQIAFPPVYRLLAMHSGFDKWNENVALQMNLKPLDAVSKEKLSQSEEFDEEWEQVLFRLCENDYYLKSKSLNISRLLNSLKVSIKDKDKEEDVEDIIGAVISLSSVTNLEAFDKPVVDYHKGGFLKKMRKSLIPHLKERLSEIKDLIQPQGKRVQSNAYIKFTENNWGQWIRLSSKPYEGKVRLSISSDKWVSPTKHNTIHECIEDASLVEKFKQLENDFNSFISSHPKFTSSKFYDKVAKREGHFILMVSAYLTLPTTEEFFTKENLLEISHVVTEMYQFLIRLDDLSKKVKDFYNNPE